MLIKESWEMETAIENREPEDPLIISLEETFEEEIDSDDWTVSLE